MNQPPENLLACPSADVAAYLDGELDPSAAACFESHVRECGACAARVREQRMLLCELDFLLENETTPELPENFAELVTVRAQADLRGVRRRSENKRAAKVCVVLGLFAFALMGGAWRETIWQPLSRVAGAITVATDVVGGKIYDSGAGVAVLSRNVGGHLFFHNGRQTALAALLLLSALFVLARLVGDYHRTHSDE